MAGKPGPWYAPDEMPKFVTVRGVDVHLQRWAASQTQTGAFAVIVEGTYEEATGTALTVAMCPAAEYAQYIAHFHNMLLMGSEMLDGMPVEDILKGYATQTHPAARMTPDETGTGGYL